MRRSQRGSVTAELAVLVPVLVVFALLAVGLARYEITRQELSDAAQAGAQAAAVAPSAVEAASAATDAASSAVAGQRRGCQKAEIDTDSRELAAGGSVTVTVRCRVDFSDLLVPGLPGGVTIGSTQTAPVDPYRVVG